MEQLGDDEQDQAFVQDLRRESQRVSWLGQLRSNCRDHTPENEPTGDNEECRNQDMDGVLDIIEDQRDDVMRAAAGTLRCIVGVLLGH